MADSPHDRRDHPLGPDGLYRSRPPWDIGRPQPAFQALADAGAIRGRVLDVGCGTGEHVLMAAGLGLHATGVDLASAALSTAREKARDRGCTARFRRHDARRLADLGEVFDTGLAASIRRRTTSAPRAPEVVIVRPRSPPPRNPQGTQPSAALARDP